MLSKWANGARRAGTSPTVSRRVDRDPALPPPRRRRPARRRGRLRGRNLRRHPGPAGPPSRHRPAGGPRHHPRSRRLARDRRHAGDRSSGQRPGGVAGADTVQSTSSQGASLVAVFFKDGTDLKAAQQDVNTALSRARPFLPPQVPASTVQTFSTNSIPILEYAVSADEPLGDLAGQLRADALPKLKGLAGVSSVLITGAPTDEVDVTLDPVKLAAHGVAVGQVASALQQA